MRRPLAVRSGGVRVLKSRRVASVDSAAYRVPRRRARHPDSNVRGSIATVGVRAGDRGGDEVIESAATRAAS